MPHFYAIAIYRLNDYKEAGLPVLPIKKGIYRTKVQMLLYLLAFIAAIVSLTALGYTGVVYLAVMLALSLYWLWRGLQGFSTSNDAKWARNMFLFSLIIILVFSLMISVDSLLP
jgi:protoheme IX farnesyltransferase